MTQSRYSICITELATEMPRCFSISIQSLVAWRVALRAFTLPAIWIAPAKSRSFSVRVVLPASGCEMIAKVRRRAVSRAMADSPFMVGTFSHVPRHPGRPLHVHQCPEPAPDHPLRVERDLLEVHHVREPRVGHD